MVGGRKALLDEGKARGKEDGKHRMWRATKEMIVIRACRVMACVRRCRDVHRACQVMAAALSPPSRLWEAMTY